MGKKIKFYTLLLSFTFFLACATTPGDNLKKSEPEKYDDIIGTWFILSKEKIGEIIFQIKFNDDGTVTGDTRKLFSLVEARWNNNNKEKYKSVNGIKVREGRLIVHDPNNKDYMSKSISYITYSFNNNSKATKSINPLYLKNIPPLGVMEIKIGIGQSNKNTYIFSRDQNTVNNIKKTISKEIADETTIWNQLNKNSLNDHIIFLKSVSSPEIKRQVEQSFKNLLDKKVITYLKQNFKSYSKYFEYMIHYQNGNELCKLHEFLTLPIVFKNKQSGEKINFALERNNSKKNVFDIVYSVNGKELNISLKPHKNKLVLVGLSSDYQENPKSWEFGVSAIASAWNKYPEDLDNIDIELLEEL